MTRTLRNLGAAREEFAEAVRWYDVILAVAHRKRHPNYWKHRT